MSVFAEISIKNLWDEGKGRTEGAQRAWAGCGNPDNQDKISGGSQSVGCSPAGGGAEEGPMEERGKRQCERTWFLWEMPRVWGREVTAVISMQGLKHERP